MISLFIDTSTKYLCIGIAKDHKVIYKFQQEAIKKQSELTIPFLSESLAKCNLTLNDIDEVNVTIGPGSFTGIRIGMCVAKVLASMKNIPLKAISSLNAYASLGKKIVILDAKAKRVYLGIYNDNERKDEMKKIRFNMDDLNEQLRIQGYTGIKDINFAILETNGQLSIIPKPKSKQASVEDVEDIVKNEEKNK